MVSKPPCDPTIPLYALVSIVKAAELYRKDVILIHLCFLPEATVKCVEPGNNYFSINTLLDVAVLELKLGNTSIT